MMNSIVILLMIISTIFACDQFANKEKKNYDDIIGANTYNKESFDRFYKMLKHYCFQNQTTKAIFEKNRLNLPSIKNIGLTSNEFKDLCAAIYDTKKANQRGTGESDAEIAFKTLVESLRALFVTYNGRLSGEENYRAKQALKTEFMKDPIHFLCYLTTRRMDIEDDIKTVREIFENVSREEAALRVYLLEPDDSVGCSDVLNVFLPFMNGQ
ncbi:uncharacterized protein LOC116344370 [Contarinia nasturtii]|uniref:uncharacterized protein LOC116344370 n=1 Tax=Contarinia nasturtii TaxID=265458 RepID=UPI0012D4BFAA|nr:uncharacterized protein LOC116344370 [Contarinia nasturtii]